jgi:hypothetical protein
MTARKKKKWVNLERKSDKCKIMPKTLTGELVAAAAAAAAEELNARICRGMYTFGLIGWALRWPVQV